jgi:hypothetical protein
MPTRGVIEALKRITWEPQLNGPRASSIHDTSLAPQPADRIPGEGKAAAGLDLGQDRAPMIDIADSDSYSRRCSGDRGWRHGGVLQRFPANLQQNSLLRVHDAGFVGDSEERGVEFIDALEEGAVTNVRLPKPVGVEIVVCIRVPAVRRNLSDGILAGGK